MINFIGKMLLLLSASEREKEIGHGHVIRGGMGQTFHFVVDFEEETRDLSTERSASDQI